MTSLYKRNLKERLKRNTQTNANKKKSQNILTQPKEIRNSNKKSNKYKQKVETTNWKTTNRQLKQQTV